MTTKMCSRCGVEQPIEAFPIQTSNGKVRRRSMDQVCFRAYNREKAARSRAKDPSIHREAVKAWRTRNQERDRAYRRAWYAKNKSRILAAQRSAKYGLSPDQIQAKFDEQKGRCPICGGEAKVLDHDHRCCPGEVTCGKCLRSALCSNCNVGLGLFDDDPTRLLAAVDYLRRWEERDGDPTGKG